jgi:hypothetical protein
MKSSTHMAKKTRGSNAGGKPGPKPKLEHSEHLVDQIRALGRIQATVQEAASVLRVSERTLQNFFAAHSDAKEAHEDGKLEGLASLRRKQFAMADKNAAMAIWLGKQYLGQRDVVNNNVVVDGLADLLAVLDGKTRGIPTMPSAAGLAQGAPLKH